MYEDIKENINHTKKMWNTLFTTCSGIPQLQRVKNQKTGSQSGVEHMVLILTDMTVLNVKSKVDGPVCV